MPWVRPAKQSDIKKLEISKDLEHPVPVFNRLIAKSPDIFSAFMPLADAVKAGVLNELETEAVIVFVSKLNGCEFCYTGHGNLLKEISDEETILEELNQYESSNAFEAHLKSILSYAEKLITNPKSLEKADLEKLKEHGYSEQEIVEINQLIAYTSYTNQTSIGLGL